MKKKKCYIYTRVSTAAQTEGYSLEAQKERLRQFAEYKDLEISGEYCDAGRFGHSIKGRPSFMEMLDDITAEKDGISFVLVYKLSRFGRNAADVLKSMQLLMDYDYQYTAEKVNLTAKMEEVFYTESVGNPFVASTLYKVVQDDAIISQKEKFGITDVRRISREKMGITAKKIGRAHV